MTPCKRSFSQVDQSDDFPNLSTSPSEFFAIELFCGSAGLTFAMRHFFKNSVGIDSMTGPAKARTICLDLRVQANQQLVEKWCSDPQCLWTHFGVPCGTSSKARLRRMSKTQHGPPPLRSVQFPLGLPNVTGTNLARVRSANVLYAFTCRLILTLHRLQKIWTLENPWSSVFWATPYWKAVENAISPHMIQLDYCMFGGRRKKRTAIATACDALLELNITCDDQHDHAPWSFSNGKFATAKESEYPPEFCRQLASCVYHHLAKQFGFPNTAEKVTQLRASNFPQIATGVQPTKAVPPLVSEFASILTIHHCGDISSFLDSQHQLKICLNLIVETAHLCIPAGTRLLRTAKSENGGSTFCDDFHFVHLKIRQGRSLASLVHSDQQQGFQVVEGNIVFSGSRNVNLLCKCDNKCTLCLPFSFGGHTCVFGLRWTEEAFVMQATESGHPYNLMTGLNDQVKDAIDFIAKSHPAQVVLHRKRCLDYWLGAALELEHKEAQLKRDVEPERLRILKPKRVALLERMIAETGYPDTSLPADILAGFDLVGDIPKSNILPKKFSPATFPLDDLHGAAPMARDALRVSVTTCGNDEIDKGLWEKTLQEVQKGWLVGPLSWGSLGQHDVVSRRFAVEQSGKIRPIDDYSQSQINSTVHSFETASVDGVDFVAAMFSRLIQALQSCGKSSMIHGRSLDLSSAYRQLTIAERSHKYSFVAVYSPDSGKAELFKQIALPFGSKAAVNAFIRCSRCLQWLAAKIFMIPLSCYYDDFVIATIPSLANSSEATMGLFLDMLGWAYDKTGPKADSFSSEVAALGVVFDLTPSHKGFLEIRNTDRRVAELCQMILEFLEKGTMTLKESQVLRGRLAFCDAFIFGKSGKSALQEITAHGYSKPSKKEIGYRLRTALCNLLGRLRQGVPRKIFACISETVFLFSDASFQSDFNGGLGAVLCDETGTVLQWFSLAVSKMQIDPILDEQCRTAIGELETIAVAVAIKLWIESIVSKHLVSFVDNEGSKYSLVKGYSKSSKVTSICDYIHNLLDSYVVVPWFTRVPSPSNISDAPSRFRAHPFLNASIRERQEKALDAFLEVVSHVKAHQSTKEWGGAVA